MLTLANTSDPFARSYAGSRETSSDRGGARSAGRRAAAAAGGSGGRSAGPGLGRAISQGGVLLVIRHTATDYSKLDEEPVDLADCRTQRNLSRTGTL